MIYTKKRDLLLVERFAKNNSKEIEEINEILDELEKRRIFLLNEGNKYVGESLSEKDIENINDVADLWIKKISDGFQFMYPISLSYEIEEKVCHYFTDKLEKMYGKEFIKKVENKKFEDMDGDKIKNLLRYPTHLIMYFYEYLVENNIYDDFYYERAFYHASLIGDIPAKMPPDMS